MSSRRGAEGAKLLLRMFGGRTKRGRQANLLEHAEHVMKSGMVEEPLWLDVMRKVPPPLRFPEPKPKKIIFPEDQLISAYYRRNPMARFTPLDLSGPTWVQRYAWRQLELMEKEGLSQNEARLRVDAEVAAAAAVLAERAKEQAAAGASAGEGGVSQPSSASNDSAEQQQQQASVTEDMLALAGAMAPQLKRAMADVQAEEEKVLQRHRKRGM